MMNKPKVAFMAARILMKRNKTASLRRYSASNGNIH